eukprot:TRINITY_DN5115_c0_g1_i1.p1 TRINITY_DN5115_c0_g1~~TRINITY_DN5115_c0_g1_i1.p1  ORF type:complete len:91 (+),score=16.97 TRINITY_DN5115_c0_g1_i1:80-352(+)
MQITSTSTAGVVTPVAEEEQKKTVKKKPKTQEQKETTSRKILRKTGNQKATESLLKAGLPFKAALQKATVQKLSKMGSTKTFLTKSKGNF